MEGIVQYEWANNPSKEKVSHSKNFNPCVIRCAILARFDASTFVPSKPESDETSKSISCLNEGYDTCGAHWATSLKNGPAQIVVGKILYASITSISSHHCISARIAS